MHETAYCQVCLMQDACKKGIDPLTFYAIHGLQIPIFARISSEVLPVSTVSGDVERIFSISGKVCSPDRSCLSEDSVNMLTSLYYWLRRSIAMNLGRMLPERRGTRDSARSVLISLFKTL